MIAKEWQKLTKAQKQKYKEAAKRDKDRFATELTQLSMAQDDTLLYKMPKKPLTAYMFFVRETRNRVAIQMPDIPPLDIMKEVGKIWQRQTETDLTRFKALATQDAIRYQEEMERFIGMLNLMRDESVPHKKGDSKDAATGQDLKLNMTRVHTQATEEEEKHPQTTSTKPATFLHRQPCQNKENLQEQKKPKTSPARCDIGELPRTPVKEKGSFSYFAENFAEQAPADGSHPIHHSKSASKAYTTPDKKLAEVSQRLFQSGSKTHRGGLSSHRKPKKPLSAYIFYSQEQRDRLKREHPYWSTREVLMQVSEQWRQIPRDKRHGYVDMACQDKRRFEEELKFLRTYSSAQLRQAAQFGAEKGGTDHISAVQPKKLCFDNVANKKPAEGQGIFKSLREAKTDQEGPPEQRSKAQRQQQQREALTLLAQSSHDLHLSSHGADDQNDENMVPMTRIDLMPTIANPYKRLTFGAQSLNTEYLNGFGHAYQGTLSPLQRDFDEISPVLGHLSGRHQLDKEQSFRFDYRDQQ